MRFFKHSGVRFLLSSGVNTVLTYIIYLILTYFTFYMVAYTISYVSGIVISYLLNSLFVFNQPLSIKKAIQYPLVYVMQFVMGSVIVFSSVQYLHLPPQIAPLLSIIIVTPITFLLTRYILTKNRPSNSNLSTQSR